MNCQRLHNIILCSIISGFSPIIAAATTNQLQVVKDTAERFVETQISPPKNGKLELIARELDSRLQLSDCPSPLEASIPGRQALNKSVTVLLSCTEENWQVYVPVEIHLMTPIVVAKRPLDRGLILNKNDLGIQMVNARFQRGQTYTNVNILIGSKVKRVVGIGKPLQGNDICMVCRNDSVIITAQKEGLNIVAKGTALSDGALGEKIKVRNIKSKRILDAKISAVGHVMIQF